MTFLGIVLLIGMTLLAISLQRTYASVPLKELKRRAKAGDHIAVTLLKAASYGSSLRALLWIITTLISASLFVVLTEKTATWLAIIAIAAVLWFGFVWLPAHEATRVGVWFAGQIAPVLAKILKYLHPIFDRLYQIVRRHHPINVHTGMYDKDDLGDLFARQRIQADNRVDEQTLEIVAQALKFGDIKVSEILTPRSVVKSVAVTDAIGPLLLDELHKSGHSRFPVFEDKLDNIVGVLYLRTVVRAKAGGTVGKSMNKQVCYVHEDQPLTEALQAILKTHQQLFVVVNSFEEYVGVVSVEDIMESIVGKQIVDEFDEYEDLRAVAAKMANTEHTERVAAEPTHENIQSVTEVVK